MTIRVRRGRRPFGLRLYPNRELCEHSAGMWVARQRAEAQYLADYPGSQLFDSDYYGEPDALTRDVAQFAVFLLRWLSYWAGPPPASLVDPPGR